MLSLYPSISTDFLTFFPVPSLLKVHLQVRGYSVFIDVEKLEAGKFEDKLIQSVQRARNFILVLSANALDKCMGDTAMKDWVHKVRSFPFATCEGLIPKFYLIFPLHCTLSPYQDVC